MLLNRTRWRVGEVGIHRALEFESPFVAPSILYPDLTQETLDQHRSCLDPHLLDRASGNSGWRRLSSGRHRLRAVHASARRSRRLEHADAGRKVGHHVSAGSLPDRAQEWEYWSVSE